MKNLFKRLIAAALVASVLMVATACAAKNPFGKGKSFNAAAGSQVTEGNTASTQTQPPATQPKQTQGTQTTTSASQATQAPVPSGYMAYNSSLLSANYPAEWSVIDDYEGIIVAFLSPLTGSADTFGENVNFVYEDVPSGTSLEVYSTAAKSSVMTAITNIKFEFDGNATFAGHPAKKIVYTGESQGTPLKWMQIYTIVNNRAFILTYTAEIPSYDAYTSIVSKIADSVVFY